jgi:hypothetical protein
MSCCLTLRVHRLQHLPCQRRRWQSHQPGSVTANKPCALSLSKGRRRPADPPFDSILIPFVRVAVAGLMIFVCQLIKVCLPLRQTLRHRSQNSILNSSLGLRTSRSGSRSPSKNAYVDLLSAQRWIVPTTVPRLPASASASLAAVWIL